MEYFKSITQSELADLIHATKKELYLSLPSIHKEIASAITYLDYSSSFEEREPEIHILVDFDSNTFRQGYGEFRETNDLISGGFDVKCLKDNRISFIISDDVGYYLFIESRSLIPAEKRTINAVKIDPISLVRLKHYFFQDTVRDDFEDELTNAIIEESEILGDANNLLSNQKAPVNEITEEDVQTINNDLSRNPPIHPDFQRKVDFYANKFQYAELHFEGQNFKNQRVTIPPELLPYKNDELRNRLITRLKLFENVLENKAFKHFNDFVERKKCIAKEFLTPLQSRKNHSILKLNEKTAFNEEVNKLKYDLQKIREELVPTMIKEINSAKENLKNTLYEFLLENPTEKMQKMGKDNFDSIADYNAQALIGKIRFPDPSATLLNWNIDTNFSDITREDLGNKEFLEELKEREIITDADINELADFGHGIEINTAVAH